MLRTNFNKNQLSKYKKSIVEFHSRTGVDRLYIKDEAYDAVNTLMPDCYALHDKENKQDLNIFWQIFLRLDRNNLHIITEKEMFENMQYYMEFCLENYYVTPQDWISDHKHF